MKNYLKSAFFLLIIPLLFLNACNLGSNSEKESENKTTVDSSTDQEYSEADRALDNEILSFAISTKNVEDCKDIISTSLKNECKKTVNAYVITDQAIENRDVKLCDKIELTRNKEYCISKLNHEIELFNEQEKEREKIADMNELSQRAVDEDNIDLCDQIEDNDKKATCRYNILTDKAISTKNPQLCNDIGDKALIEFCKSLVDSRNAS